MFGFHKKVFIKRKYRGECLQKGVKSQKKKKQEKKQTNTGVLNTDLQLKLV